MVAMVFQQGHDELKNKHCAKNLMFRSGVFLFSGSKPIIKTVSEPIIKGGEK